jgi:hypothetical protein
VGASGSGHRAAGSGHTSSSGEKLPDVARIHTRPKKLKYFFILSLNQTIKQSE